jgi:hypothetical protein
MINKDQIDKFISELNVRITARGHYVQSISYSGHAAEITITLLVDNKYDFYVIYDDFGHNRWLRILDSGGYAV